MTIKVTAKGSAYITTIRAFLAGRPVEVVEVRAGWRTVVFVVTGSAHNVGIIARTLALV